MAALDAAAAVAAPSSVAPNGAQFSGVSANFAADLDGDGATETVIAVPSRGTVRLEVRDAAGRHLADAKAPSPPGEVVPVTLTSGPLGSAGALIEVVAATDKSECRSIWRYRDGRLTPLPIRDASGRALPDCGAPAGWTSSWLREGDGRPAAWARERTQTTATGPLLTRDVYAFAGFSLDFDAARSSSIISGVPIPDWYAATLYSRAALETLYSRFRLGEMRREPTLRFRTDRTKGIFELHFEGPKGSLVAPIDTYAAAAGTVTLGAQSGDRTARVSLQLEGPKRDVPFGIQVSGLGDDWDRVYSPAGSWESGARRVFPSAADELATNDLAGEWSDSSGRRDPFTIEGAPPYRLRIASTSYEIELDSAMPPFDVLLLPREGGGRPWGIVLKGSNALERTPLSCTGNPARPPCRPDGETETLRRSGARINVR